VCHEQRDKVKPKQWLTIVKLFASAAVAAAAATRPRLTAEMYTHNNQAAVHIFSTFFLFSSTQQRELEMVFKM